MTGPVPPQTYVDSLNAITGKPTVDVRRPPWAGSSSAVGEYRPLLDAISIRSDETGSSYDRDRAHEAGHRVDPAASYAAGDGGAMKNAYVAYLAQHPGMTPTGYAATNSKEQFAEAFADATDLLRRYAPGGRDPHTRALAVHDARSSSTPGTVAIVDHLLSTPLYANHPLRSTARFGDAGASPSLALPLAPAESTKQAPSPSTPHAGALPLAGRSQAVQALPLATDSMMRKQS